MLTTSSSVMAATSSISTLLNVSGDYFDVRPLSGSEFDRQEYAHLGATLKISNIHTVNGNGVKKFTISKGDTWVWQWIDHKTNKVLDDAFIQLTGFKDEEIEDKTVRLSCWYFSHPNNNNYEESFCGDFTTLHYWAGSHALQCIPEGLYRVVVLQNGHEVDGKFFQPSKFNPGEPKLELSKTSILPDINKPYPKNNADFKEFGEAPFNGETTHLTIKIEDNIMRTDTSSEYGNNCGEPIPEMQFKLSNTIEYSSQIHVHFDQAEEPGTGRYISSSPEWISLSEDEISLTGVSDENGQFIAEYQAGVFGVKELITAIVIDEETGKELKGEIELDIKVPNLVALDSSGLTYTLLGSYQTHCDIGHNYSEVSRRSHYVTPTTYQKVQELHDRFFLETGVHISINDASLQYGGFFDRGKGDRLLKCHRSHRKGIDFDVNTGKSFEDADGGMETSQFCENSQEYTLNCVEKIGQFGNLRTLRKQLDYIAEIEMKLLKIKESTIHYRVRSN